MTGELQTELESWPQRLDRALKDCGERLKDYLLISTVASTQDIARQLNVPAGTAVIAGAQTAGRGRYGRRWSGDPAQGVYVSIVLAWGDAPRMAIAAAIGVADALRNLALPADVSFGVKWPNDVLARDKNQNAWRKISGALVEQFDDRAILGIGVNVLQTRWPDELAQRAVSLHQLGCNPERIAVIEKLLPAIEQAMTMNNTMLARRFSELDMMTGRTCAFISAGQQYTGTIMSIEPVRGIHVRLDGERETRWFSAESTTLHAPFESPAAE